MLAWTWGTWPNVLVDFGRELYVPWRLTEGEVLYRDIAYFNGPLSPYLNALWFRLFGVGLRTLVACNGLLLVGLVAMLYALLTRVSDRVGATAACLLFVTVFAFSQIDAIGNDNYLTPYSHEVTHGLLLSLAALLGFTRYRVRPLTAAATSGFALGLVWLTKAEIFAATGAALAVAFALTWWSERRLQGPVLASLGVLVAAALCPPVLALALLSLAMPTGDALTGILGSWPSVFEPQLTGQYFYRATLGILDVEANLRELLEWSAGYTAFALALVVLGRCLGGDPAEGSLPEAEGSFPGAEGSFPGAEGSSPEAEGSSPGAEGSSPEAEGSFSGAEGSSPGAEGSSPNTRPGLLRAGVSRSLPLLCWGGGLAGGPAAAARRHAAAARPVRGELRARDLEHREGRDRGASHRAAGARPGAPRQGDPEGQAGPIRLRAGHARDPALAAGSFVRGHWVQSSPPRSRSCG